MIDGLLEAGIRPEEIAFFTQNDGYGDAGYQGAIKALKAEGYEQTGQLVHGRYTRNTINVEGGLSRILDAEVTPRAIIMVGAYKPSAAFIKLAKAELPETIFLNVSFVGSIALAKELGKAGQGVIVTQVVPNPYSNLPAVHAYRSSLMAFQPEAKPEFTSLEGYLAAQLFVEGLKKTGPNPTREAIIDGIEAISEYELGTGINVTFGKTKHQASHKIWPTIIRDGKLVDFDWLELKDNLDLKR